MAVQKLTLVKGIVTLLIPQDDIRNTKVQINFETDNPIMIAKLDIIKELVKSQLIEGIDVRSKEYAKALTKVFMELQPSKSALESTTISLNNNKTDSTQTDDIENYHLSLSKGQTALYFELCQHNDTGVKISKSNIEGAFEIQDGIPTLKIKMQDGEHIYLYSDKDSQTAITTEYISHLSNMQEISWAPNTDNKKLFGHIFTNNQNSLKGLFDN